MQKSARIFLTVLFLLFVVESSLAGEVVITTPRGEVEPADVLMAVQLFEQELESLRQHIDDPNEIQRCYDLGCNNFVSKPVDPKLFSQTIRDVGLFVNIISSPCCQ